MNPLTAYLSGVRHDWHALKRAFVTGAGVVDPADTFFGRDTETFSPAAYGDYLAASNGVYAASSLRANLLSSLPLKLYRVKPNGDKDEVTAGQLWTLLHKVNPFWTFGRLLRMTELGLCLWGTGYWFVERGGNGRGVPQEIWWARPDRVRVVPHATEYISGFLLKPDNGGPDIPFGRDEAIWLPYANPIDQFSGLAPLAAARLSADVASAAMKSNRNIFANGMQTAGIINPPEGQNLTKEQADELEETFSRRMKGVDRAHRVAVMRYQTRYQQVQMTPKDAEFIEAMKWSLEDICRAFGVPLDMLGGQRTYANLEASERMMWANTIKSEAAFLAEEITEQLLPMFTGRDAADVAEFDLSDVDVLKESENDEWDRWERQIKIGARVPNEYRKEKGLDPVPWGDVWWAPINLVPVDDGAVPIETTGTIVEPTEDEAVALEEVARILGIPATVTRQRRAVEYGSTEHERIMRQVDQQIAPWEKRLGDIAVDLLRRQRRSALDRLRNESDERSVAAALKSPFDLPRWIRAFREAVRPLFAAEVKAIGQATLDDLALIQTFDDAAPQVIRFVEQEAQRFGRLTNETTWKQLRDSYREGLDAGETKAQLEDRLDRIMANRLRDAKGVIAVNGSYGVATVATVEAARQSGVVAYKVWTSQLDERVRPTHVAAHGQTVKLDDDFDVGAGTGQRPHAISVDDENMHCRCYLRLLHDVEVEPERAISGNGHKPRELAGVKA